MATKIEWADATINPVTGCDPVSEGCLNCYAARMTKRNLWHYDFQVHWHPDRMFDPPQLKGYGKRIFLVSMGDFWHKDVEDEWRVAMFKMVAEHQEHQFFILTKRALTMYEWMDRNKVKLPNLWLGVSVENGKHEDRLYHLGGVRHVKRFVSVEPMLGPVSIKEEFGLGWVICGAETGPGKRRMTMQWGLDLKNQCEELKIPFFFKKNNAGHRRLAGSLYEGTPKRVRRLKEED